MTIEEAILHAEEVADRCAVTDGNIQCENDHRQLAEWLKDYKRLLEQENVLDKIRAEILNDWQIKKFPSSPFSCGLRYAVEIIEKYRGDV